MPLNSKTTQSLQTQQIQPATQVVTKSQTSSLNLLNSQNSNKNSTNSDDKSQKTLIIYLSYPGLGDSLFYSHLPRIAKTANKLGGGGIMIKSIFSLFITFVAMITKGSFGRKIPMSMAF